MIRHLRRATTLLIAAGLLTALAGCAAPFGASLPPSAPRTAPITTPSPDAPTAVLIVVGADGFAVLDEDEATLYEAAYADPVDAVVAQLGSVLGEAPVVGEDAGHIERPPYTTYAWGGFRLGTAHGTSDLAFDVLASGRATGGVEVGTAEGIGIGSTIDAVRATYPATVEDHPDFVLARGPSTVVDASQDPPRTLSVAVYVDAPSDVVTRIFAPVDSSGP